VIFIVDPYSIFKTTDFSDKCKFVFYLGFCIRNIYGNNIQNMYNLQQGLADFVHIREISVLFTGLGAG
jgi:hypothetical protein